MTFNRPLSAALLGTASAIAVADVLDGWTTGATAVVAAGALAVVGGGPVTVGVFGLVDQADYGVWRANFGSSLKPGSGSSGYGHRGSGPGASDDPLSAVPEPASLAILLFGALLLFAKRPRVR